MQQINVNKEVVLKLTPVQLKVVMDHLHSGVYRTVIGTLSAIEEQVSQQILKASLEEKIQLNKILENEHQQNGQ